MGRVTVTLDDEHAGKLASAAAQQNVQPGALARSLLVSALDDAPAVAEATPEVGAKGLAAPASQSDPEVELLANGDLLVPVAADGGGWRITRLAPEAPGYAGWLSFVQQRDRGPGIFARGVGFWSAAIIVLVGTWFGFLFFVLLVKAVFD